jgi:ankyrin repeat protein
MHKLKRCRELNNENSKSICGVNYRDIDIRDRTRSKTLNHNSLFPFVLYEDLEALKLNIQKIGTDLEFRNHEGETALLMASRLRSATGFELMNVLLENGSNVNATNNLGETSLIISCRLGLVTQIEMLISKFSADVNVMTKQGKTALHFCNMNMSSGRHGETFEEVLHNNELAFCSLIRAKNINVNLGQNMNPFHHACISGNMQTFNRFICVGANVDQLTGYGSSPLHLVVKFVSTQKADLLISCGVNIDRCDASGSTALHIACQMELDEHATIRVKEESVALVLQLLLSGASAYARDSEGNTPLHIACKRVIYMSNANLKLSNCHLSAAFMIASRNSDCISITNNDGKKPFDLIHNDSSPRGRFMLKIVVDDITQTHAAFIP